MRPIPRSFKPGESVVLVPGADLPISWIGDAATRRMVSHNDPWIVKRRTSEGYYVIDDRLSVRVIGPVHVKNLRYPEDDRLKCLITDSRDDVPGQDKEQPCFTFHDSTPRKGILGHKLQSQYVPKRQPLFPTVGAGGDALMQDALSFSYLILPAAGQPCASPDQHDFVSDIIKCWNELISPFYRQGYELPGETDMQEVYRTVQSRLRASYAILQNALKQTGNVWEPSAFNMLTAIRDVTAFAQGELNFLDNTGNSQQRGTREWCKYTAEWKAQINSLKQAPPSSQSPHQPPEILTVDELKFRELRGAIRASANEEGSQQGRHHTVENLLPVGQRSVIRYSHFMHEGEMYGTPPYGDIVSAIAAFLGLRCARETIPQPQFHSKIVKVMTGTIDDLSTKAMRPREEFLGVGVKRPRGVPQTRRVEPCTIGRRHRGVVSAQRHQGLPAIPEGYVPMNTVNVGDMTFGDGRVSSRLRTLNTLCS